MSPEHTLLLVVIEPPSKGTTLISCDIVSLHPSALVPVTIYLVVEAGVAVTADPVEALKPFVGVHE